MVLCFILVCVLQYVKQEEVLDSLILFNLLDLRGQSLQSLIILV